MPPPTSAPAWMTDGETPLGHPDPESEPEPIRSSSVLSFPGSWSTAAWTWPLSAC